MRTPRIKRVDPSQAGALPGVRRVFTGAELEGVLEPLGVPFSPEVLRRSTSARSGLA